MRISDWSSDVCSSDLDVDQHLAVVLRIDQPPHHLALGRRQRFEEIADLGGSEGVDQPPHGAEATAVECVGKHTQLARGLVVAYGFGHAVTSVPESRHVRARQGSSEEWRVGNEVGREWSY